MNKQILGSIVAATLMGGASLGVMARTYTDSDGNRIECTTQTVQTKKDHPIAGPVVGAVVGGVVGNQIGGGSGKDIATGVGAAGGAIAGQQVNKNRVEAGTQTQEICRRVS